MVPLPPPKDVIGAGCHTELSAPEQNVNRVAGFLGVRGKHSSQDSEFSLAALRYRRCHRACANWSSSRGRSVGRSLAYLAYLSYLSSPYEAQRILNNRMFRVQVRQRNVESAITADRRQTPDFMGSPDCLALWAVEDFAQGLL